jgi:hypothetical protein
MNEIIEIDEQSHEKRPKFLLILTILSFISIGYSTLGNLMSIIGGKMDEDTLNETKVQITTTINEMDNTGSVGEFTKSFLRWSMDLMEATNEKFILHNMLSILILIVGFAGVLLMFKGKKIGFHIYITYSIFYSILIYILMPPSFYTNLMVGFNLFISAIFVILYSMNLKWMK